MNAFKASNLLFNYLKFNIHTDTPAYKFAYIVKKTIDKILYNFIQQIKSKQKQNKRRIEEITNGGYNFVARNVVSLVLVVCLLYYNTVELMNTINQPVNLEKVSNELKILYKKFPSEEIQHRFDIDSIILKDGEIYVENIVNQNKIIMEKFKETEILTDNEKREITDNLSNLPEWFSEKDKIYEEQRNLNLIKNKETTYIVNKLKELPQIENSKLSNYISDVLKISQKYENIKDYTQNMFIIRFVFSLFIYIVSNELQIFIFDYIDNTDNIDDIDINDDDDKPVEAKAKIVEYVGIYTSDNTIEITETYRVIYDPNYGLYYDIVNNNNLNQNIGGRCRKKIKTKTQVKTCVQIGRAHV